MKRLIVGVAIALLVAGAQAQVPRVLSYQGILTDSEGRILPDGEYHLTIRLYDRLEATEPLYVEEHRAVAVRGVVNVLIGTVEPLPWRLAFDRVYYVGVSVNGSEELRPRTMLTAVPYALRAETATVADVAKTVAPEALKGVTVQTTPSGPAGGDLSGTYPNPTIGSSKVTTVKIATGAVTTDKLANSSVTTVKIADNAVTTAKITNGAVTYGKLQNAAGTNRLLVSGSGGAWGELSAPTTSGQVLTFTGSGLAWQSVSGTVPNGSAAGQLLLWNGSAWAAQAMSGDATITSGGVLTIANDAVTSAKIADGTIVDADISSTAAIAVGKLAVTQNNLIVGDASGQGSLLAPGTNGQVLTIVGGAPAWANVSVTETDPVWTAAEPNYGNLTQDETVTGTWTFNNTISGSITGNAGTATALQTARDFSLSGDVTASAVSFNGTANVTLTTTIADGAVTSAKIADNAVTTAKLANGAVTDAKVSDVAWTKITGAPTSFPPSGAAGGDLTGTYPNPSIANDAVTSSKIADGTIVDADISSTAAIAVGKLAVTQNNLIVGNSSGVGSLLAPGTNGQVLTIVGGVPQWQSLPPVTETDPEVSMTAVGAVPRWDGTALVNGSLSDNGSGVLSRAGDIAINPGSSNLLSTDGSLMVGGSATISGVATVNQNLSVGGSTTLGQASASTPTMILSQDNTNAALTVSNADNGGLVALVDDVNARAITLAKPTLTANRTWTLPDLTGTVTVYTNTPTAGHVLTWDGTSSSPEWKAVSVTETDPQVGTLSGGQVAFWSGGSGGALTGSNNLYWDATNDRLGIGTSSPGARLHVAGDVKVDGNTTLGDAGADQVTIVAGTVTLANVPGSSSATDVLVRTGGGNVEYRAAGGLVGAFGWALSGNSITSAWGGSGGSFLGTTNDKPLVIATTDVTNPQPIQFWAGNQQVLQLNPAGTAAPAWSIQRDAGGNTRGLYAVDLQAYRTAATQVASGNYSVIGGGALNTASGLHATVGGGLANEASDSYATIGGGLSNKASDIYATVGGGLANEANDIYATVSGGGYNSASGDYSAIPGGYNLRVGNYSFGFSGQTSGTQTDLSANSNIAAFVDVDMWLYNVRNQASQLRLYERSNAGTNYTAFQAQDQSSDITYTLPADLTPTTTVAAGLLQTDGSGNLSWVSPSAVVGSSGWLLAGNSGTTPWNGTTGNFVGTTDAQPLVIATTNTATPQPIQFLTGNTERMRIAAGGNVGIGTSSPATALQVVGTVTATQYNGQLQYGVAAGTGLTGGTFNNTGDVTLSLTTTGVSAGTYGSGTQVAQITVDAQGRITSAANVAISFPAETDPQVDDGFSAGQVGYWTTSGTPRLIGSNNLYWDATNDRLGIGTSSPGARLHVAGDVKVDGNTTLGDAGADQVTIVAGTVTAANLPTGTSSDFVVRDGSNQLQIRTISNIVTGTGTPNRLVRWTPSGLGDGSLDDNGNGTLSRSGDIAINPGSSNQLSTDGSLVVGGSATISGNAIVNSNLSVGGSTTLGQATVSTPTMILSQDNTNAALDVANYGSGPAIEVTGHIQPSITASYDLGSTTNEWQNIYTTNAIISGNATVNTNLNVGGYATFGTPTSSITVQVLSNTGGNALEIVNHGSGPALLVGANGNGIKEIMHGTVSVDPPAINANSSGTLTVTITGVAVGDRVFLTPPNDLEDALIFQGAAVTGTDTVTIKIRNVSGSNVDGASRTWHYLVIKP